MPKTLTQMKKRLEEAMNDAREAEELIPLLKEVIAKFELVPADLFEAATAKTKAAQPMTPEAGTRPTGSKAVDFHPEVTH